MSAKIKVKKGDKYGRLTIIKEVERASKNANGYSRRRFLCLCSCGNKHKIDLANLRNKSTVSCGCNIKKYGVDTQKWTIYRKFHNILQRCTNPKNPTYKNYGGRGIKCEWKNFDEFRADMETSYLKHEKKHGKKETTIERVDVNGNYSKENCIWATWKVQFKNKRPVEERGVFLVEGIELKISEIIKKYKLKGSPCTIAYKLRVGTAIDNIC
jgi:hypothetical protein